MPGQPIIYNKIGPNAIWNNSQGVGEYVTLQDVCTQDSRFTPKA